MPRSRDTLSVTVSILAGGLSARMGRDKSRLRLGGRTMLGHARALGRELGLPVRVIRRDLVPRCGPLGGIFTALKTSRADAELFLACDMPFLTPALLRKLLDRLRGRCRAAFTDVAGLVGFPFALRIECLPVVEGQIRARSFSVQTLARTLRAARVSPPRGRRIETFNVNTPPDLTTARARKQPRPLTKSFNARLQCAART
jgi:molybdopterin-guanine dinucleotide biosynthesis protein A